MWASLKNDVLDDIVEMKTLHPDASILITGHSAGGAIATLAALEII